MAPHPEFGPQMFQLEDVKTMAKREWGVIEKKYDPIKGKMVPYLKSTTQYTSGEMFFCMQGLQAYAGGLGCILESTGEYLELLREADGRP
ncbi:MAG: hypothetical protein R3361_09240 [Aequorivita vladivostokensis]|nr:hypothetical protein [Aequorivita vladivostokensis]